MDYKITNEIEAKNFLSGLDKDYTVTSKKYVNNTMYLTLNDGDRILVPKEFGNIIGEVVNTKIPKYNPLIFGKDQTERIVSIENLGNNLIFYKEISPGKIETEVRPFKYWIIGESIPNGNYKNLEGSLFYKYLQEYDSEEEFLEARSSCYKTKTKFFSIYNIVEAAMVRNGITYFKGMKFDEVSVLSFDIETATFKSNDINARVLLISNTYRAGDMIVKTLFSVDDYDTDADMIKDWSDWVRKMNPTVMIGHNVYGFDFPYMNYRYAKVYGENIPLGRDNSCMLFNEKSSRIRKDGSQNYEYFKCFIHGREIIDTWFLSLRYDTIYKKYESYGLKPIVEYEYNAALSLPEEKRNDWHKRLIESQKDRQFYDASLIGKNWHIPEEREKIKKYCINDADDALFLYDLMAPSYFYLTTSVPKAYQTINESATGAQINAFMVRSYLQDGHSLPKANAREEYEGAISFGESGIYHNVRKIDVASLYPSIMRQWQVYDKEKDPRGKFLETVEYFTIERLNNKKLAKETGEKYYADLEQSEKVFINSLYGFLGSEGLLFNSPKNAAFVTRKGREILTIAINWAKKRNFCIPNGDTDSISFCRADGKKIEDSDFATYLKEINSLCPEKIIWEDDGEYEDFVVLKAKNYIKNEHGKITFKGSSMVDSKKELAMREYIEKLGKCLLKGDHSTIVELYESYVVEAMTIDDINRWTTKKTITESVLNPTRANEQKVLDAIKGTDFSEGDKIWVYYDNDDNLKLVQNYNNDENKLRLVKRVYATTEIFIKAGLLNKDDFIKYANKGKLKQLEVLVENYDNAI